MRHYMIGISGFSGTGKDTIANRLIEQFKAIRIGLADPAKRHMADLYGFTEEQLFGPSEKRNAGDLRYPKHHKFELIKVIDPSDTGNLSLDGKPTKLDPNKEYYLFSCVDNSYYQLPCENVKRHKIYYVEKGDPNFWLSPRETLQGHCELMNTMYLNTWIRKSIETQIQVAREWRHCCYSNMKGISYIVIPLLIDPEYIVTCSPDFRHKHEIKLTREYGKGDVIPIIIRVKMPSIPKPPYQHRSELEQATIPDSEFDFVLNNDGSIHDLDLKVDKAMKYILESGRPGSMVSI